MNSKRLMGFFEYFLEKEEVKLLVKGIGGGTYLPKCSTGAKKCSISFGVSRFVQSTSLVFKPVIS